MNIIEMMDSSSQSAARALLLPAEAAGATQTAPIVVFLHSAVGGPEDHIDEALKLTGLKCHGLLIEAAYSKRRLLGQPKRGVENPDFERRLWNKTSAELTYWIDRLSDQGQINPKCLDHSFAIGFNLGGSVIASWLKRDRRLKRAIICGSVPELTRYWRDTRHPAAPENALQMRDLDLTKSIMALQDVALSFQFGSRDEWIDPKQVSRVQLKTDDDLTWFDDDHDMKSNLARERRLSQISACVRALDSTARVGQRAPPAL